MLRSAGRHPPRHSLAPTRSFGSFGSMALPPTTTARAPPCLGHTTLRSAARPWPVRGGNHSLEEARIRSSGSEAFFPLVFLLHRLNKIAQDQCLFCMGGGNILPGLSGLPEHLSHLGVAPGSPCAYLFLLTRPNSPASPDGAMYDTHFCCPPVALGKDKRREQPSQRQQGKQLVLFFAVDKWMNEDRRACGACAPLGFLVRR